MLKEGPHDPSADLSTSPSAPIPQIQFPPFLTTLCLPAAMHVVRSSMPSPSALVDQRLVLARLALALYHQ